MTCDRCQQELQVGEWPWCPHGQASSAVIPDDIPGGQWFENGFATPQKFYSHSAHRAALAANGLEIAAKYAGDGYDKHLTDWGAGIDAKTLDNARVLLERGIAASRSERARIEAMKHEFPITVTEVDL